MIVLVDTNVLLSAALRDRLPEQVVIYVATNDDWKWIVTPDILAEYIDVLHRPKFRFTSEMLAHWSALIDMRTVNVPVPPTPPHFSRDPKDARFWQPRWQAAPTS
jgi:putative PIN family toxin of toxin-antitoxin system